MDNKETVIDDSATESESDVDSVNDNTEQATDEWIVVETSGSDTLELFQVIVSPLTLAVTYPAGCIPFFRQNRLSLRKKLR